MSRLVEPSFSDKADSFKVWIFAEDLSRENRSVWKEGRLSERSMS